MKRNDQDDCGTGEVSGMKMVRIMQIMTEDAGRDEKTLKQLNTGSYTFEFLQVLYHNFFVVFFLI